MAAALYDIPLTRIDGTATTLAPWRGDVLLVVNVASQCGFTPQYTGLEALHRAHEGAGLRVLGFPCDQFGHQEPGTEQEIAAFCSARFDVTFPMFKKVEVNGANAHPLFRLLKAAKPGLLGTEAIKWNFTKFLVGRDGRVLRRYGPGDTPEQIEGDIVKALASRPTAEFTVMPTD
ncbi:MAG: glutathione peroxidase [Gemmatimonadetes bacterium]|nr:glutathione peroxidase [Gemmatimonadota bacterium]